MLEERKVQKAKIRLMRHPKFALLSGILMVGKTSVVDNIPTACTNGRDEKYGRKFVAALNDAEIAFVIAHEASHKMYRHLTTWRKLHDENHKLANAACDYVINLMLKDLDPTESVIAMPKYRDGPLKGKPMGMIDERFRGMNTKQVFDILKQEQDEGNDGETGEGGGGDGESGDGDGGIDDHDWDGANELTEEEKKELERDIDQAIRQGQMAQQRLAGKGNGSGEWDVTELLEPKINWRDALREYVKSVCQGKDTSTWSRVNRRFLSSGVYMPTLVSERVKHVALAIDTSGSVWGSGGLLQDFLSEFAAICEQVNPEIIDVLYWDCQVAKHETYTGESAGSVMAVTKPTGGGGTAPSCVTQYMKENNLNPEIVVVLTDGYVGDDWGGDWPCPVLWAIMGNPGTTAPNGKTINVGD